MNVQRVLVLAMTILVPAACGEGPPPTAPEAGSPAFSVGAAGHRVVGSGHVEGAAGLREFTFHATEGPDGQASGSYKIVLPNGLFVEVDVTCLAVDGATGWVAGTIRDSNAGFIEIGSTSMFWATDGGEGASAGDVVSLAAVNLPEGADLAFCRDRPLELAPMDVTQGNVDVR